MNEIMNLTNKKNFEQLQLIKNDIKKIFFYRICGTGMGAAACLLKEQGYEIEGGDNFFAPPMSDYLKKTGIPCHHLDKVDKHYLQKFDLIVVGNVVPRQSADARLIEDSGVLFASFPSTLGAFVLSEQNVVGIAGTHGKTTTTYFMAQLFEKLGKNPGHFIGGVLKDRSPSRLGDGSYFFIESDEYDSCYFEKISKFRMYALDHLILTSLEFDHADIYNNLEEIKDQFRAVIPNITNSYLFNQDYEASCDLAEEFSEIYNKKRTWAYYGEKSSVGPLINKQSAEGTSFSLIINGRSESFKTNIVGFHNILNLSACILFASQEGFGVDEIRKAVLDLKLVKRRQEERGIYKGALFIDDFAHHPRAVAMTINGIKIKYKNKKLFVIIEPHSATARSNIFQKEFASALEGDHHVIILKPSKSTTAKQGADLDCQKLFEDIKDKVLSVSIISQLEELRNNIEKNAGHEVLFLVLSNGTCLGLWQSDFAKELK